ncbi:AAA family ATPase [Rubrimonas cliftonensis]|uniref:MoxR-like ATPase n=1 Tax=Rubrimonas cliftonensis TaxID=89524 RepID=A0A1H4EYZ0_9RHOB|nr:MoxR family ATPase [Rubrimonas cliftonensis]SEA89482.1 MoxR-like ATPase [Rubrimonas cliftonensis]
MSADAVAEIEAAGETLARARDEIAKRVIGQQTVVDLVLNALISGGHALLVGAPGLAKTRLVETLGVVLGMNAKRVQFTPDLMPADILGAEVLEEGRDGARDFRFIEGPIFCQLLMADEINRASPRTQSALLQAMQEKVVTVAGANRRLPHPFHVLATQNPIEQEGTYPLPEAQLDRFILQVDVDYPSLEDERRIVLATTGVDDAHAEPVMGPGDLEGIQKTVRRMPAGETVVDAILKIVRAARPDEPGAHDAVKRNVAWGPGPRAAQALMMAVRAKALIEGRLAPSVADVVALARPAMKHRMALTFAAKAEGGTVDAVIDEIAARELSPASAAAA